MAFLTDRPENRSSITSGLSFALTITMRCKPSIRGVNLCNLLTVLLLFLSLFTVQLTQAHNSCSSPYSHDSLALEAHSVSNKLDLNIHLTAKWSYYDRYPMFNYESFRNILFLSDAGKAGRFLNQTKNDSQLVVSSDFSFNTGIQLRVDNNRLPFRSNSFDLIVMNRGLCPCKSAVACGGIDTQKAPMKRFLEQVVDILDKDNPKSLALLTGFYYPGTMRESVPRLWLEIVREIQGSYPQLKFHILQARENSESVTEGFMGLAVTTDLQTPLSTQLKQLEPSIDF